MCTGKEEVKISVDNPDSIDLPVLMLLWGKRHRNHSSSHTDVSAMKVDGSFQLEDFLTE